MALLYGRAGRLAAKNGGFRPGQEDVAASRAAGAPLREWYTGLMHAVATVRRGAWARVTIGQFRFIRRLALRTFQGHTQSIQLARFFRSCPDFPYRYWHKST